MRKFTAGKLILNTNLDSDYYFFGLAKTMRKHTVIHELAHLYINASDHGHKRLSPQERNNLPWDVPKWDPRGEFYFGVPNRIELHTMTDVDYRNVMEGRVNLVPTQIQGNRRMEIKSPTTMKGVNWGYWQYQNNADALAWFVGAWTHNLN